MKEQEQEDKTEQKAPMGDQEALGCCRALHPVVNVCHLHLLPGLFRPHQLLLSLQPKHQFSLFSRMMAAAAESVTTRGGGGGPQHCHRSSKMWSKQCTKRVVKNQGLSRIPRRIMEEKKNFYYYRI